MKNQHQSEIVKRRDFIITKLISAKFFDKRHMDLLNKMTLPTLEHHYITLRCLIGRQHQ